MLNSIATAIALIAVSATVSSTAQAGPLALVEGGQHR